MSQSKSFQMYVISLYADVLYSKKVTLRKGYMHQQLKVCDILTQVVA